MPLTKISMRSGKSAEFKAILMEQAYLAMNEVFDVPKDDFFMTISEHDDESFRFGKDYLNIKRSDDLIIFQLTIAIGRTVAQKKNLYAAICERLVNALCIRPEDIFINLVETKPENWSFGMGKAQKAWGDYSIIKDATKEGLFDRMTKSGNLSMWL